MFTVFINSVIVFSSNIRGFLITLQTFDRLLWHSFVSHIYVFLSLQCVQSNAVHITTGHSAFDNITDVIFGSDIEYISANIMSKFFILSFTFSIIGFLAYSIVVSFKWFIILVPIRFARTEFESTISILSMILVPIPYPLFLYF